MPAPEVQIALANLEALARARVLLIGFEGPDLPEGLIARGSAVTVHQHNLRAHRSWPQSFFGDWFTTEDRFDAVALTLPKEKGRLSMELAMIASLLADDGVVFLTGHNDAGIRSANKQLSERLTNVEVVDYRFHCRLLRADRGPAPIEPSMPEAWRTESHAVAGGRSLTFFTYPGVFSHRALDDGTRMLLDALQVPTGARVLDVGCGSGVIATTCALAGAQVDAIDVDAWALRATRETLDANGVGAQVWPSDVYSDVGEKYRVIVSNPPFHTGVKTSRDVASSLIDEAPAHLERHGELWLVANRFLDYLDRLRSAFTHVEIAAEDKRFRVYRARP